MRLIALSLMAFLLLPSEATAQHTRLTAPTPAALHQYGVSVAVGGGIAVVGANRDNEAGADKGAIYVYRLDGGTPAAEAKLLPVRPGLYGNAHFGLRLATDGTRVVTGIHTAVRIGTFFPPVGAVAVYSHENGAWAEEAYIENPAAAADFHEFGFGTAIDGDILVIGAPGDREDATSSGRAYIYRLDGADWTLEAVLSPPTAVAQQRFGEAVDVDGGRVIVGAPGRSTLPYGTGGSGVYVYTDGGDGTWTEEANLTQGTPLLADRFGSSIATSWDRVLVSTASVGAGHVFLRAGDGTWSEETVLTVPTGNNSGSGAGALAGDRIVLGAFGANGAVAQSGVAYVYNRSENGWGDPIQIQADDGAHGDAFGIDVATDGQHVFVGAFAKIIDDFTNAGAAYLFTPGATPTEEPPTLSTLQVESPFPNPFRGTTQIEVTLERPQPVEVGVYDALGRRVGRLHDAPLSPGTHRFSFDALSLPAGMYFIRIATADTFQTRPVILLP